jgi:hypothetical protein
MGSTERGDTVTMGMQGITVPGSRSEQRFNEVAGFPLEFASTVIVMRLRGAVDGAPVAQAITVDRNPVCSTCGRTNRAAHQFCSQCGTYLTLL